MNIHQYPGDIFYASREFTDQEARDLLRFPCWVFIKDDSGKIVQHIGYNKDGEKAFVKYSDAPKITKTSQLTNDGEDGSDKFSTVGQLVKKLSRPEWTGAESHFFVVSSPSSVNLRPITVSPNQVPYWSGNTFFSSPIYVGSGINIGISKSDPAERLDVNGNVRADNFRYNVTTANSVPLKDWSDGLRRYFTDRNGVNHEYSFAEDLKMSSNLLERYIHNSNQELYPTAFDVSTGNITVPNHGLTIGSNPAGGVIPNSFKSQGFITSADWKSIPYEWTDKGIRVKVIDANTLQIVDSNINLILINNSSTENNGNINFTKWHIELISLINMPNLPIGIKDFKININGFISLSVAFPQFKVLLFDYSGNVFSNDKTSIEDNVIGLLTYLNYGINGSQIGLINYVNETIFSCYTGSNKFLTDASYIKRNAGANNFPSVRRYTGDFTYQTRMFNAQPNNGLARLANNNSLLFNGTTIEIYKA